MSKLQRVDERWMAYTPMSVGYSWNDIDRGKSQF